MRRKKQDVWLHLALIAVLSLTLLPFVFVINNAFRTNQEMLHTYFGAPKAVTQAAEHTRLKLTGREEEIEILATREKDAQPKRASYWEAMAMAFDQLTEAYGTAWNVLRSYTRNTIFVCLATVAGVIFFGSISAYVFSRYRFPGRGFLFMGILSLMMIPGILTLVPSFLWVKQLGLLNSYWVLILPYIAGGQVFAIFLFKSFFDGLPGELFESARLDGAGHMKLYWKIVMPLSKPIISVVAVVNILGTWNNFLWPFITNTDKKYHVVSSGLFLVSQSQVASNRASMFAAYVLASIPLLILFIYATKPFMQGVTSGAFKA